MNSSSCLRVVGLASAVVLSFAVSACSKEAAPTPPPPAKPTAAPAAEPAKSPTSNLVNSLRDTAKQSATKVNEIADTAKRDAEAAANAAKQPMPSPATPTANLPQVPTPPAAAISDAQKSLQSNLTSATATATDIAKQAEALKAQGASLLTQYSGELETLKSGAAAVKKLIDQNASLLPASVSAKYQELNGLLPELGGLVDTLKNYQTADLTTLIPKVQADFTKAQKLWGEIKALIPAGVSLPAS